MRYRSFFHALLKNSISDVDLAEYLASAVEHAHGTEGQLAELQDDIDDMKERHREELQELEDRRVLIQKDCPHIDCENHVCTVCGLNIFSGR